MKKLYIVIALVLYGFAQIAEAKNMYRSYGSANLGKPTSAVSVVHSNGYVYFFQADENNKLSATEIDPLSMLPTGNARNASLGIKDPFVEVFTLVNYNNIVPNAAYCVLNQTFIYPSEFNSLHVQIDNDNLILYHNLRYSDNTSIYDNIWLTRIKNYWNYNTASVSESWIYRLPNSKLFDKDMLYDPYNNRLNFLGEFNKCREGTIQLLAQIDPFSLSSGIEIGQLGAGFMGGVCFNDQPPYVDLAYNDLEMSNLTLDIKNPCHPVLIAGVGNKMSILTETYDISLSKCDVPMWHEDKQVNPILKPYSLNTLPLSPPVYHVLINGYTDPITTNYICDEPEACSHQFGGKSLQQPLVGNPTAKITVESGRQFVCEGFEGVIQYSLYDMAGRLLQQGETCNGKYNSLKMHSGAYLLKATDATGRQMVKKIILY